MLQENIQDIQEKESEPGQNITEEENAATVLTQNQKRRAEVAAMIKSIQMEITGGEVANTVA